MGPEPTPNVTHVDAEGAVVLAVAFAGFVAIYATLLFCTLSQDSRDALVARVRRWWK